MNLDRIGKYRVVGRIGKGAMGEVFKAHDPLLNRYVAIKTISPSLATEADFKSRFQREAQSAARLNHQNIVTVFDFGEEEGGLTYMAMELLEGHDLKEVIRSRDLPLADRLAIMGQLCDGLAFAHEKGVVHRDLKPSNIHLQPNGTVKILDFGLARLGTSEMTKTGTVMGTPHYMSPEQVRGQKADPRSDVFSLGAVFYELLSQHRPFDAASVHTVLFQILEKEPEPIRRWAPDTPPPLVDLVEKALAKDPAARFANAGEMGRALAAARGRDEVVSALEGSAAGETLSTMLQGADATVVEPTPAASVRGATALSLHRTALRPTDRSQHPTVRPDPTVAGPGATHLPARGPSRGLLFGGVAVAVVAATVGGLWILRSRATSPAASAPDVSHEQVGILTEALVTSQVELARADLANRDYGAAAQRAEGILKLSAGNADAQEILDQARHAQQQIDQAAGEARAALGRDDTAAASEALGRVMALDPAHPVVAELSGQLNQHFRQQAEDSRQEAARSRTATEQGRATSASAYTQGRSLAADAEALFGRGEYAVSAQKFLEARNAFERAQREAEEARAAAARPAPTAQPVATAARGTPPPTLTSPSPTAAPVFSAPPTTVAAAPTAAPTLSPHPSPSASLSPPALSRPSADEEAVRRVIAEYGRAIQTQDVDLFRRLKPDLSKDEEKRLREAFKVIKSQVVGIAVQSIAIEGTQATVKVVRQDQVNGRSMKPAEQTFRLARDGGSWLIQSIGQ